MSDQSEQGQPGPAGGDIDLTGMRSRPLPAAVDENGLPVNEALAPRPDDQEAAALEAAALARVDRGDWTRVEAGDRPAGRSKSMTGALIALTALLFVPLVAGLVMLVGHLEQAPAEPFEPTPPALATSPAAPVVP